MATMDVSMYDYNGAAYAFGVISGYSTVQSVRMYVSDGHGNTYQYLSKQVYNRTTARINTSEFGTNSFMFHIQTDRDTEGGSPKQLSYNVKDPEDSSGRGRYKISFHFYSTSNGTGNPLNSTPLTPTANGNKNAWYQMHNSLSTPSVSFNENTNILTVTGTGSRRCNIRITRKNRLDNPDFPSEIRDYAYRVNMQSLEGTMGGKYTENYPGWIMDYNSDDDIECKYQRGGIDYSWYESTLVRVLFDSGAGYSQSTINSYMSMVRSDFNEISEYTGMVFDISYEVWSDYKNKTNSEVDDYIALDYDSDYVGYLMYVRIGNETTMSDVDTGYNGYWNFYTWSNWREDGIKYDSNFSTSIAHINTTRATNSESVNHVIHEEIYQSLNIGIDCFDYPLSIHYDPHYPNPDTYDLPDPYNDNISWDKEVLKFFYTYNLAGKTPIELINEYDTPCCLVKNGSSSTKTFDLSELASDSYIVEAWVCAQGSGEPGGGTWSRNTIAGEAIGTSHYNWDGGWDDAPYSLRDSIEIKIKSKKPPLWSWTSSNGSATASQTQDAYNALIGKDVVTKFSYLVWNDMVNKVKAMLDSIGESWNSSYATYENTLMTSSDKTLTATKFNSLRFNIGSHSSTGITDKYTGDDVYGSYFTTLANHLNIWIGG